MPRHVRQHCRSLSKTHDVITEVDTFKHQLRIPVAVGSHVVHRQDCCAELLKVAIVQAQGCECFRRHELVFSGAAAAPVVISTASPQVRQKPLSIESPTDSMSLGSAEWPGFLTFVSSHCDFEAFRSLAFRLFAETPFINQGQQSSARAWQVEWRTCH